MQEDLGSENHRIITKLKAALKTYEDMDVTLPKGCIDFAMISEYDHIGKIKKYVIERIPYIIEWLETEKLPTFNFDPTIKVGCLLNDPEVIKVEDEIIIAQRDKKYGSKAF